MVKLLQYVVRQSANRVSFRHWLSNILYRKYHLRCIKCNLKVHAAYTCKKAHICHLHAWSVLDNTTKGCKQRRNIYTASWIQLLSHCPSHRRSECTRVACIRLALPVMSMVSSSARMTIATKSRVTSRFYRKGERRRDQQRVALSHYNDYSESHLGTPRKIK